MHLEDSFYLDEVIEGFYVPTQVKAAWGAQLDVFYEVDRICARHNIDYYADWGTLLGAIRHGGYVPWDDDLDICMKRSDYNLFLRYAKVELPEGFEIMNYKTREGHLFFVTRITSNSHICFEPEYLNNFHGFPYLAGIDLFILDNVDKDRQAQRKRAKQAEFIITSADAIAQGKLKKEDISKCLSICEEYAGLPIDRSLKGEKLRIRMYELAEVIFAMVKDEDSDALVQMMPYGMYGNEIYMDRKWFRDTLRLPFMNTTICVPLDYDAVMRKCYGEYIKVNRGFGGHDYPFFAGQHREFVAGLDFEYPEYHAKAKDVAHHTKEKDDALCTRAKDVAHHTKEKDDALCTKAKDVAYATKAMVCEAEAEFDAVTTSHESYKHMILADMKKLRACISEICSKVGAKTGADESAEIMALCADAQDLAVNIGNLTESVKGEGNKAVSYLECLCERIFEIYENIVNSCDDAGQNVTAEEQSIDDAGEASDLLTGKASEELSAALAQALSQAEDALSRYVIQRKDVVFLTPSPNHFAFMKALYDEAVADENTDAYLVPIPYYYKNYDGSLRDMQYDCKAYENPVDYSKINLKLMHPDKIITTAAFDEWDTIVSVDPAFYSSKIKDYTSELVLVQHFCAAEFVKENYPEYHNMKYYVNVPGVMNANTIIVQDEWMKHLYIEKIMEFIPDSDDELKGLLEAKITVRKDIFDSAVAISQQEAEDECCEKLKDILNTREGKKIICYETGLSEIDEYKEAAINKIKRNLEIFRQAADKVTVLWQLQNPKEDFNKTDRNIADELLKIIDECRKEDYIIFDDFCDSKSKRRNVFICDAYYGDPSDTARMFNVAGKPVLIQNINI